MSSPFYIDRDRATVLLRLASLAAVVLVLAGAAMSIYSEAHFKSQKIREARALTQILAASVTAALVFDDDPTAQEYVDALQANAEVQGVVLFDANGVVVASYRRAGTQPLPTQPSNAAPVFENNHLIIETPVQADNERLGSVYLQLQTEPLIRRILRYGGIMLLVIMGALLVVVLGSSQRTMTRANRELEKRAAALADLNARLNIQMAEREQAQEALRQSQKMEALGQLVGGVAHDFNNILTAIINNLESLRRRMGQDSAVENYVPSALQAAHRGASLIQQLMVFSRKERLDPQLLDINAAIDDVLRIVERSLPESIILETERAEGQLCILADPAQFQTALLNLILNARDAMDGGGEICLGTAAQDHQIDDQTEPEPFVCLAVTDSGNGISEENLSRIFEPFFTTKEIGKGTGLGLSQVFGFMNSVGGEIKVTSAVGKGTRFKLFFPLQSAEPAMKRAAKNEPAPVPEPEQFSRTDGKLLYVEDDFLVSFSTVDPLEREGFTVFHAPRASDALQLLQIHPDIELLITDIGLPGMNGHDFVAQVRLHTPELKVIFVTGYDATEVGKRTTLDERTVVMNKPYDVNSLIREIGKLLQV